MLAANMAAVLSQPRTFNGRVLRQRPMMLPFVVISIISNIRNGVETPCTMEENTSARMGLMPMKFSPTASAVKIAMEMLNRFTSRGG